MKLKKFNEDFENKMDISNDRTIEIINNLNSILSDVYKNKQVVLSFINELSKYTSETDNHNDQIDDSVTNLEISKKSLTDAIIEIEKTIENLKSYNENGRKKLY